MSARLALLALALLVLPRPAAALDPRKQLTQYRLDVWQIEDGLPENSVQQVLQTRDGYLWVATQEGLVRFDGVRFHVFDKAGLAELRNNFIAALAEGRDGSLWVGTGGGGLTRLKDGLARTWTTREGLASNVLWAVHEDRRGTLWLGTQDSGLCRFAGGRFETLTKRDGLASDRILALAEDREGTLWIGTDGGGVSAYRDGGFRTWTTRDGLPSDVVYALAEDHAGDLWLGTLSGLARLRGGSIRAYGPRDGVPSERVNALLEDRHRNLWIGTEGGGLVRHAGGRFARMARREGLSSDIVRALHEDGEGMLWVGTVGGGLDRLKDGKITMVTTREGLPRDVVWGVYEDRDGDVWLATDGGGLARMRGDRVVETLAARDGLASDNVRALVQDAQGALWIGTWGGGLSRFRDGAFTNLTTRDGLPHDIVRSVYADREGDLWVGTYGGGLARLHDGSIRTYTTRDGLPSDVVYCTLEDRSGTLWIGTRGGGLGRLRGGVFETFTTRNGLPDDVVLTLHEDAEGSLWIGTRAGIARFRNGRFSSAGSGAGLCDDLAYRILEDSQGNLWASSNKGIYRFSKQDFDAYVRGLAATIPCACFGTADGMRTAECTGGVQPAGWRARDGRLYFPTVEGVAVIDVERLRSNERPPPVVIEEVTIDGQRRDPRQPARAGPGRGELHFRYTGLAFGAPEKVRFRRKLVGFDADWVEAETRREATYTNIPPGSYVFRVVACNEDGVWNQAGASFAFELAPHFHQTSAFHALLGLVGLAAGSLVMAVRFRGLRRRERELLRLVAERTDNLRGVAAQLEQANEGLREAIRLKDEVVSVVAHDLRSPLTVIKGYAELLEQRAAAADTRRALAALGAEAERLAAVAADTLTLSRIESGDLGLELRRVDLGALLREVASRMGPQQVQLALAEAGLETQADPERLVQALEQLVATAQRLGAGGPARVGLRRAGSDAEVSVAVAGPGVAADAGPLWGAEPLTAGPGGTGGGLGLYIARAIVEAHGGRVWLESGPDRGTTLRLTLPTGAAPDQLPGERAQV